MNLFSIRKALIRTSLFSLLFLGGGLAQAQQKPVRKGAAVKHAEAILGKPLNDAQTKTVRIANSKRQQKLKPIQEEYRVAVAKALGLSLAQYKAREAKLRSKNKKG